MATPISFEHGPYLSAALICEKVLEERDGVKSAIRIIDRVTRTVVGPSPPAEMEPFTHEITILIRLKSGEARGHFPLRITLVKPSGESPPYLEQTIVFEGEEDRGVDLVVNASIKIEYAGIYWFWIYLEGVVLTRIPFRVVYVPQVSQIQRGPGGGPPPVQEPPTDR